MSLATALTSRTTEVAKRKVSGRTNHDFLRWLFAPRR